MIFISLVLLFLSTAIGWYVCNKRYNNDVFNPANVFFLWQSFNFFALFLFSVGTINLIDNIHNPELGFFNFVFVLILYQLSFTISYYFYSKKNKINNIYHTKELSNSFVIRCAILVLFVLFVLSIYSVVQEFGSVLNLLLAMAQRGNVLAAVQFEFQLMYVTSILLVVLISLFYNKNRKVVMFFIIIIFILNIVFTGSRANSFLLIVIAILVFHYNYKKFTFKLTHLTLSIFGIFIFILTALLRKDGAIDIYINDYDALYKDITQNLGGVVSRISLLNENIFIYSEYNLENLWLGASFADLIYYPVPRSYFPLKPPLDEGVYIYSRYLGIQSLPSTPLIYLFPSSWPLKTESAMYVNFWYFGVVLGGIITAFIYNFIYRSMLLAKGKYIYIFWLTLYCLVVFGKFQLTNIGFISLVPVVLLSMLLVLLFKIKYNRRRDD